MAKPGKPVPEGYHTITPHLVVDGAAKAIDFYTKAFGAAERGRMPGPDGKIMHAEIKIGDSIIMLSDDYPEMSGGKARSVQAFKGTPVALHIYVENVDQLFAQAVAAGAKATMPVADMFWGDRYGKLQDPFGFEWSIATHKYDYTREEMNAKFNEMMAQTAGAQRKSSSAN